MSLSRGGPSDRVGCIRVLTHRANFQTQRGPVQYKPRDRHEQVCPIDQQILAEENLANSRDIAQAGEIDFRKPFDRFDCPQHFLEEQIAHPQSEKEETNAADPLFRVEVDGDVRHGESHDGAHEHGSQDSQPKVARGERNVECSKGTQEHLTLNAEVEHPTFLSKGLTDRGV